MPEKTISAELGSGIAGLMRERNRWHWAEAAFWLVALSSWFLLPGKHLILNEIAITALFALSLDLLLGYAGIVSLGHAAFFGFGAYLAGLFAKHIDADPLTGLAVAAAGSAALGFVSSFLVLRGSELTILMITLGVALVLGEIANQAAWLTGGADGLQGVVMAPVVGLFRFDLFGRTAYAYSLITLFVLFLAARRIMRSPYGLSVTAIRDNRLRAAAVGIPVNRRLVGVYTLAATYAGVAGALLAQTTQFVSLDVLAFTRSADVLLVLVIGGAGYLYGGILGALVFKLLQDWLSAWTPQYWHFWIGLVLVMMVLFGRVYGFLIAVIIFGIVIKLGLSFFECVVMTLAVGLGRNYIVRAINLLERSLLGLAHRVRPPVKPRLRSEH